ncbi:MAG: SIS domain-containing protein [bacterium]|nr:SIS domain-containing protein [bacterium]
MHKAARFMQGVLKNQGTFYIFGNGGSYALARHFEATLKESLKNSSVRLRTNCGIDPCSVQMRGKNSFANEFVNVLKPEKANANDAILFISGSGDSDNLIRAARYARKRGVPTVSISGFGGGKIARNETDLAIAVPINDQQIVEDAMQSILRLIAYATAKLAQKKRLVISKSLQTCAVQISRGLNAMQESFVLSLAEAVSAAFSDYRGVYILAPERGRLSFSAEHTAHNFNWDAVYQIAHPPQRRIYSTPTYCDFSGIGNDRLMPGIVTVQQLDKARPGDLLLLLVHDPQAPSVLNVLVKARQQKMEIFLVSGKTCSKIRGVKGISLRSQSAIATPDIMQMFGHITARVLRLCIRLRLGEAKKEDIATALIEQDMAQRRLLRQ